MSRKQTVQEENLNVFTHALGILFCLIAMPFLFTKTIDDGQAIDIVAVIAFAIGMLLVYSFSTLYHWVKGDAIKKRFKTLDHISIYFLIAGSYTPVVVKYIPEDTAILFMSFLWGFVGLGIIFKLFFIGKFKKLSVLLYLLMGWMVVFIIKPLVQNIPIAILYWILAGGLSYTIGVYFYVNSSKKKFYHSIWHIFVLGGTVLHFFAVYYSW